LSFFNIVAASKSKEFETIIKNSHLTVKDAAGTGANPPLKGGKDMLVLTLREGDYILIGDNIRVHFDYKAGQDSVSIGIEAPGDELILRGKLYEKAIAQKAASGDESAKIIAAKLKKERNEKQRKASARRKRSVKEGGLPCSM